MENKEPSKEFIETLKDVVSRPEQLSEYIQAYISIQSEEFKAEYETYNKEQSEELARVIIKDLVNTLIDIKSGKVKIPKSVKGDFDTIKTLTEMKAGKRKTTDNISFTYTEN